MKKLLLTASLFIVAPLFPAACVAADPVETGDSFEPGEELVGEAEGALDPACATEPYMRVGHSGLCLAPVSNSIVQPSWVGQYECVCPANTKVKWNPVPVRSSPYMVAIRTVHANVNGQYMCIDRPNGSTTTHLSLQSYPCHYGPAQQWLIRPITYGGTKYWQYEAAYYDAAGAIVASGKCIDLPSSSTSISTVFQLYPCKTTSDPNPQNQFFHALW